MDIRVLFEYSGQGKCREVMWYSDTAPRYKEQLRIWARSRNWRVTRNDDWGFIINNKRMPSNWDDWPGIGLGGMEMGMG